MAKKLAQFLKEMLTKAGVAVDSETVKPLLEAPEIQNVEVADEIATGIDNGLLSLAAAKNKHPEIRQHYYALALGGVDQEAEQVMQELGLSDDAQAQVKAEKSTARKVALLAHKIKEAETAKHTAGKGEKETLNQEIIRLNNELRAVKDGEKAIKDGYEKKLKDKDRVYAMRGMLGKYKTIYDDIDVRIKDMTLNAALDLELAENNAEFVVDENGAFKLQKKDGSNYFGADNQLMTPEKFIDQTFTKNKFLKNNDVAGSGNQQNNTQNQQSRINNGQQQQNSGSNNSNNGQQNQNQNSGNANNSLSELAKKSLRDMEKSVNPIDMGVGGSTR